MRRIVALLLLVSIALAHEPGEGAVMWFHGTVFIDGTPAADGTLVSAKVGGVVRNAQGTVNGTYGVASPFKVTGEEGETVDLYVGGTLVRSVPFQDDVDVEADLSVAAQGGPGFFEAAVAFAALAVIAAAAYLFIPRGRR